MEKRLVDTDILLEITRAKDRNVVERSNAYLGVHGRYTFSVLTVTEIVRGLRRSGRDLQIPATMELFRSAEVLPLDLECAELAGRIYGDLDKAGEPIGRIDPLIAATALRHDLTLVTGNTRHFERVRDLGYDLRLDDWRRPDAGDASL